MFTPSDKILKNYANVLIKFALWGGKGVKRGEVVYLQVPESAKPILIHLQNSVLESGAHPIIHYSPEDISRNFYEKATEEQITWMPEKYILERVNTVDHFVSMISTNNKFELKGVDSKKIMLANKAAKFYMDARRDKENAGKLTWTLALFGTEAMAKEAHMSLEDFWDQIIKACFLDLDDPIAKWKEINSQIYEIEDKLDALKIEWLQVEGPDVDLKVKLGNKRKWLGGRGRNIPSFELFTSPDFRGTEGKIKFNQPLYRYGNLITGIELEFKDGLVVSARAKENEQLLKDMIAVEGANRVGEFSLTDKRFSRITKFMAETLFDENIGGEFGNTHIALGMAYRDAYQGDPGKVTAEEWKKLGYNESAVHTDIISTTDRTVTATLPDGSKKIIYQKGQFQL